MSVSRSPLNVAQLPTPNSMNEVKSRLFLTATSRSVGYPHRRCRHRTRHAPQRTRRNSTQWLSGAPADGATDAAVRPPRESVCGHPIFRSERRRVRRVLPRIRWLQHLVDCTSRQNPKENSRQHGNALKFEGRCDYPVTCRAKRTHAVVTAASRTAAKTPADTTGVRHEFRHAL